MIFIVSYETIDGNDEVEREFTSLLDAEAHVASLEGLLQWHSISDENGEIDPDHYCTKHNITTGEGDICHMCEEEFDHARKLMDLEMHRHPYQLWFVCSGERLYKCPVSTFDAAKMLYYHLTMGSVTGVRIARMDPEQGCESVLYNFK